MKSDELEIGQILHLKLEIKKSQIGRSDRNVPLISSNLRFLDF
jgi:hypothetical protein